MADVYRRLAKKLDRLPQGFPATDERRRDPPPPEDLHARGRRDRAEARADPRLRRAPRAQARAAGGRDARHARPHGRARADRSMTTHGEQRYLLMPFVVGIYEFQLRHIDRELAELFEAYAPHLEQKVGGHEPALARVVPVNQSIDTRLEILGYEDMRGIHPRGPVVRAARVHLPQGAGAPGPPVLPHARDLPGLLGRAARVRLLQLRGPRHHAGRGAAAARPHRGGRAGARHLQRAREPDVRVQLLRVLLRVPARPEGVRRAAPHHAERLRRRDRRRRVQRVRRVRRPALPDGRDRARRRAVHRGGRAVHRLRRVRRRLPHRRDPARPPDRPRPRAAAPRRRHTGTSSGWRTAAARSPAWRSAGGSPTRAGAAAARVSACARVAQVEDLGHQWGRPGGPAPAV